MDELIDVPTDRRSSPYRPRSPLQSEVGHALPQPASDRATPRLRVDSDSAARRPWKSSRLLGAAWVRQKRLGADKVIGGPSDIPQSRGLRDAPARQVERSRVAQRPERERRCPNEELRALVRRFCTFASAGGAGHEVCSSTSSSVHGGRDSERTRQIRHYQVPMTCRRPEEPQPGRLEAIRRTRSSPGRSRRSVHHSRRAASTPA